MNPRNTRLFEEGMKYGVARNLLEEEIKGVQKEVQDNDFSYITFAGRIAVMRKRYIELSDFAKQVEYNDPTNLSRIDEFIEALEKGVETISDRESCGVLVSHIKQMAL